MHALTVAQGVVLRLKSSIGRCLPGHLGPLIVQLTQCLRFLTASISFLTPLLSTPLFYPQQVNKVTSLDPAASVPFVGEALRRVKAAVGNEAAVLGFIGAPFTMASYIIEGGSSKNFAHIKRMAFSEPEVLHALLSKLADNLADYVRYQVCVCVFSGPEMGEMRNGVHFIPQV